MGTEKPYWDGEYWWYPSRKSTFQGDISNVTAQMTPFEIAFSLGKTQAKLDHMEEICRKTESMLGWSHDAPQQIEEAEPIATKGLK